MRLNFRKLGFISVELKEEHIIELSNEICATQISKKQLWNPMCFTYGRL